MFKLPFPSFAFSLPTLSCPLTTSPSHKHTWPPFTPPLLCVHPPPPTFAVSVIAPCSATPLLYRPFRLLLPGSLAQCPTSWRLSNEENCISIFISSMLMLNNDNHFQLACVQLLGSHRKPGSAEKHNSFV